ncbi:MAG: replication protein [Chloroflexota bacterium]|nr:replication protein [Chloroflexota bacterium]
MSKKPDGFVFAGFDSPRYTPTPDQIFDELLAPGLLTEAELRVLLYIVRRTFGWKKELDNISLSQITGGIVKRDGTRLDFGAGVAKSSAVRAIKGLVEKGIILSRHNFREDGGSDVTTFALRMRDPEDPPYGHGTASTSALNEAKHPLYRSETRGGSTVEHGGSHSETPGSFTPKQAGSRNGTGAGDGVKQAPVRTRDTQHPSIQETEIQQSDDSNRLSQRKNGFEKSTDTATAYSPYIAAVLTDFSDELGDSSHTVANVTQALRLWGQSGADESDFVEMLYEAKRRTRLYQGKQGAKGIQNKIAYFFTVLRDLVEGKQ